MIFDKLLNSNELKPPKSKYPMELSSRESYLSAIFMNKGLSWFETSFSYIRFQITTCRPIVYFHVFFAFGWLEGRFYGVFSNLCSDDEVANYGKQMTCEKFRCHLMHE